MTTKRKTPPISFYLGDGETAKRRKDRLQKMAVERGITRSILIQLIADGIIPLGDNGDKPPRYIQTYEPSN